MIDDIPLYRIVKFHDAISILNGTLYFSHPSKWDDPYETRVRHAHDHSMFAQCWSTKSMSDAMWRVYSPDHLGVRLKTTSSKLDAAMETYTSKHAGRRKRIAKVNYSPTRVVTEKTEEIVSKLATRWDARIAADLLYHKRTAFNHESEVRAVIYCPSDVKSRVDSGLKIAVDGHDLINSILFDPRAPRVLIEALKHYLQDVIKYKGWLAQSKLYTREREYVVGEDEEL